MVHRPEFANEFDLTTSITTDLTLYAGWEAIPLPVEPEPSPSAPDTTPTPEPQPDTSLPDTDAEADELAATGGTADLPALFAAGLLVAMGAGVYVYRRRGHALRSL